MSLSPREALAERVAQAVAATGLDARLPSTLVQESARDRPSDYQSSVAMALAKQLRRNPADIATTLLEHLDADGVAEEPQITAPGFINFRLRDAWLGQLLDAMLADPRLGIPLAPRAERIVIDLSSPNAAKEMHVGHLRSTIIGDALIRLLRFAGHEVVPQNHLGDWGTPFGMLIEHLIDEGTTGTAVGTISDLNAFYQAARQKFDGDPDFADRSRQRVVLLQGGDPDTHKMWEGFIGESERHLEEIYALLGVGLSHDDIAGESIYNSRLDAVVEEFSEAGLAVVSDGATVVYPPGFRTRSGDPMPLILRKSDGGYTYDTTDLAALRYRLLELRADRCVYVVGAPQRLHFELIFAGGELIGWLQNGAEQTVHVAFGSVLGSDNKMLRTRAGRPVRLIELLDEAVARASEVLAERSDGPVDRDLATAIGIGAVKYADLSNSRERDYVFSLDRMLSLDGNTSVYLQYANARIHSVLRRAESEGLASPGPIAVEHPAERTLALTLTRLPDAWAETLAEYAPHKLTTYLFELATAFTSFYEQCPVLKAPSAEVRNSRLSLCALTCAVLDLGLRSLGIAAPHQL